MDKDLQIETLILEGIDKIRNERRKRPGKKDLYHYVSDFQDRNILDYDHLLIFMKSFSKMVSFSTNIKMGKKNRYTSTKVLAKFTTQFQFRQFLSLVCSNRHPLKRL